MDEMEQKAFIFGGVLLLANKLQILGDKLDPKITLKRWLLLAMIVRSKTSTPTISEIASYVGSSRQNVKKMASILEKQGFVNLKKDEKDARILRVEITDKCMEHLKSRDYLEQEFMSALFQDMNGDILKGLYEGLIKLSINVDAMEKQNEKED